MPSSTIQRILEDAARKNKVFDKTAESMTWFRERARRTNMTHSQLLREYGPDEMRTVSQVHIGGLYMYLYDPKHKETLPYYDKFPCMFLTDMWRDASGRSHFAGINLHYLPYKQRALLMDALYDLENNAKLPKNKRLQISYRMLKSAATNKWFAPCYKRYLKNHVRSRLIKVPYEEWHTAVFLPVQSFEKASSARVWSESMKKIKR